MNETTEAYTTWLYKDVLKLINTKQFCCTGSTAAEVYGQKMNSALDNISTHFAQYVKIIRINELRRFGCEIYPITPLPKMLYEITQGE